MQSAINTAETVSFRRKVFETMQYAVAHTVDLDQLRLSNMRLSETLTHLTGQMVLQLNAKILSNPLEEERTSYREYCVPTSWWQMFKQQYFPARLLQRFPVKTEVVATWKTFYRQVRCCPHLPADAASVHCTWLDTAK